MGSSEAWQILFRKSNLKNNLKTNQTKNTQKTPQETPLRLIRKQTKKEKCWKCQEVT